MKLRQHLKETAINPRADLVDAITDIKAAPDNENIDALLPCPFCEGEPLMYDTHKGIVYHSTGCWVMRYKPAYQNISQHFGREEINQWNYRREAPQTHNTTLDVNGAETDATPM